MEDWFSLNNPCAVCGFHEILETTVFYFLLLLSLPSNLDLLLFKVQLFFCCGALHKTAWFNMINKRLILRAAHAHDLSSQGLMLGAAHARDLSSQGVNVGGSACP